MVSGESSAIKAAQAQPSLTAVQAIVSSVTQVKTSAGNLQNAISENASEGAPGQCSALALGSAWQPRPAMANGAQRANCVLREPGRFKCLS